MTANNRAYTLNKNEGSSSQKNLYQNVGKNDLVGLGIQVVSSN